MAFDSMRCVSDIKLILGITDTSKDTLLLLLSEHCVNDFVKITRIPIEDVEGYRQIIENMVCYRYSLIGAEGINGENYNGYSVSYSSDYPEQIKKEINAVKRCKFL